MIRVMHVITDSNIGGAGHMLLALLDACDRASFRMEVVLPQNSRLIPAITERGVACTEAPYLAERSFSWRAVRVLYTLIKKHRPDIVHTHAALSARLAARLCGCRIVHTRHSVFTEPGDNMEADNRKTKDCATSGIESRTIMRTKKQIGGRIKGRIKSLIKGLIKGLINNSLSDAMIAVSPAASEDLMREGADKSKITVIYNGVSPLRVRTSAEKAALRDTYGVPSDAFVVAQIARLVDIKGHDYTLDACKLLEDVNMVLLMAGDGPRQAHLARRLAEERISHVRLLGFVDAVEDLANIMDVQVNASYGTEATSLALLQGMSLGVPAVVSDYGGNPYVITHEENGLVVPQKDAAALAAAIRRLAEDAALYRKLSDGARRQYAARFTVEEMAAKTAALYRRLVKDGCK